MTNRAVKRSTYQDTVGPKGVPYGQIHKIKEPIHAYKHRLDLPTYAVKKLRRQALTQGNQ